MKALKMVDVKLLAVLIVICVVAAGIISGKLAATTDSDVVSIVKEGSRQAVAAIQTGKGRVIAHHLRVRTDGSTQETEVQYELLFKGGRYRLSIDESILKNEPRRDQEPGIVTPSGTKLHHEIAVDGYRVTYLEPGRATVGDASKGGSRAAWAFNTYVTDVGLIGRMVPGNGLVDLSSLRDANPSFTSTTHRLAGREFAGGGECIKIEMVAQSSSDKVASHVTTFWFDPQKGYAAPRVCRYLEGGPYTLNAPSGRSQTPS